MGYKVSGIVELNVDDLKNVIKGSQLLSSMLTYDRSLKNLSPVTVDESYFIRYAINCTIADLEKSCNFNEN